MFTFNLFVPFSHSVEISFLHPFNTTKSSMKSSESITPRFLSPSSIRSILPSTEILPPVTPFSGQEHFSITFVFRYYLIELHQHPCTGECKKNTPSSIHFHSGSPSLSLTREKKTFDRSIPPNLAFSLNQIIIPVLFSRVLLCCEFRYSSFLLSLRLLLSCLGFLKNLFI